MRILHLGKYYAPYLGGMETVLQNQVEGLLDAGVQVSVLVAGEHSLDTTEHLGVSSGQQNSHLTRMANWGNYQSQPLTFSLFSQLRQQLNLFQPDLVQIHLPNPLALAVWVLMNKTQSMPKLALWHHADITRQRVGAKVLHPLMDLCMQKADGIAVSSLALKENSGTLTEVKHKVSVVPFGIKDPSARGISQNPGRAFLFVGRLVPYKGLTNLIDAINKVPDSEVDIVGSGPLYAQLNKKISDLKLDQRIRLRGSLPQSELDPLMAHCRALVLPSVDASETFGLVQLEAMAAGKPIIASDLPTGVAEVNRPGQTGLLVPPGDVDSLATALNRCLADDDLVRGWGQQARQIFLDEYTRDHMVKRLLAWYEMIINPIQET